VIDYLESHVVYENPKPHVHSRHGYFPGALCLPGGELICLFVLAEAFEAPDGTTFITRSKDSGRTWHVQGPLYDKRVVGFETTDALKATLLADGRMVAVGYRFHRHDPEQAIGIEETGGVLPGDNIVCFSDDCGKSWTVPQILERSWPELIEVSGPCVETASGDLLAVGALMKLPDGSNPSGQTGVLLRSRDGGSTWDDREVFFQTAAGAMTPLESRICEMQPGRLVVLSWAYDTSAQQHRTNHVVVSHDNGRTWSAPIDTGHWGQASNLFYAGGDKLLTIHAHRGPEYGLFVRLVDFSGDCWQLIDEKLIWDGAPTGQTGGSRPMIAMFKALRFGQPSLVQLHGDEFLAFHWVVEDGQGRIRAHRIRVAA